MNDRSDEHLKRIVRILKDIVEDPKMTDEEKIKLVGLIF